MKIVFIPFSVVGGVLAGILGKKLFEQVWSLVDEEDPPEPKDREVSWGKVLTAAAVEGAVFRATRAAVDRGSRTAFLNLTGSWPGEQRPPQR
ncbi:MAG: DUF4235 domain-containing protein [Thermoleophilaceae bacterium]